MEKLADIKNRILSHLLEREDERGGPDLAQLADLFAPIPKRRIEKALRGLRDEDLVAFVETFAGIRAIGLTPSGVEVAEGTDDGELEASIVKQSINVTGGNVQIGDQNVQNVTYANILHALIPEIEAADDVPSRSKRKWIEAIQELLKHPLTQTVIGAATALGTNLAK